MRVGIMELAANEIWRPVAGFETSHEVSNLGRVRTIRRLCRKVLPNGAEGVRTVSQRVLRLNFNRDGYFRIALSFEGRQPRRLVHRVVAEAFLGAAPSRRHEVNHIDGDKRNNRSGNLEWVTRSENGLHSYANGLSVSRKGALHGRAKLSDAQVAEIKRLEGTLTQREIAARFGVKQPQIHRILAGKRWAHVD